MTGRSDNKYGFKFILFCTILLISVVWVTNLLQFVFGFDTVYLESLSVTFPRLKLQFCRCFSTPVPKCTRTTCSSKYLRRWVHSFSTDLHSSLTSSLGPLCIHDSVPCLCGPYAIALNVSAPVFFVNMYSVLVYPLFPSSICCIRLHTFLSDHCIWEAWSSPICTVLSSFLVISYYSLKGFSDLHVFKREW